MDETANWAVFFGYINWVRLGGRVLVIFAMNSWMEEEDERMMEQERDWERVFW